MRIIWGAFAQGHGHFSKAAVLVPILERWGHEVRVVTSGQKVLPEGYQFTWHRHFPGLSYVIANGKADPKRTLASWISSLPRLAGHVHRLRSLMREFQPDLIVSDFEPLSANPLLDPPCEVVALSRQVSLLDPAVPLPASCGWETKVTKAVTKFFTTGASRTLGYHYSPASPRCVPPIIRRSVADVSPELGEHIVVYNHYFFANGGEPEELVRWANRNAVPVKAYGFPQVKRGRDGMVTFCAADRVQMPLDLATSRGVLTTSGFTTPVECYLLGKPTVAVPIPGNWEQNVNACQLDADGISAASATWDYDRVLSLEPPDPNHPLKTWLSRTPEEILACVVEPPESIARPLTDAA